MEDVPDEIVMEESIADGHISQPELRNGRRRFVQSTLFPHKPQEDDTRRETEECEEKNGIEEDCQSSQDQKRRRKPRACKKVGSSCIKGEDDNSLAILKKRSQRNKQIDQQCLGSPEENERTCSPSESKPATKSPSQRKRRVNCTPDKPVKRRTPKKNSVSPMPKESYSTQVKSDNKIRPIPNLRLEAKFLAEENARISAGRQIHPFFSSRQTMKKRDETTETKNEPCNSGAKTTEFSSIHVFKDDDDSVVSLDWGNWVFLDRSFISSSYELEYESSPIYQISSGTLSFDGFPSLHQSKTSVSVHEAIQHEVVLGQSPIQQSNEWDKMKNVTGDACHESNLNRVVQLEFLEERASPNNHTCNNCQQEHNMWTNKYRPDRATEVCGNETPVRFLSDWLRLWREKGSKSCKDPTLSDKHKIENIGYASYHSDTDYEDEEEDTKLDNVLLVTGPVGSGKSAAIYACAKEHQFRVLEVNTSDWRNGSLLLERFGEGVKNHSIQRYAIPNGEVSSSKSATSIGPSTENVFGFFSDSTTKTLAQSEYGVIQMESFNEENLENTSEMTSSCVWQNKRVTEDHNELCLILFEDVDVILPEDRGFVASIQQIASKGKWPIILTCNNDPVLPTNLRRLELCFETPSLQEVLWHINKVCSTEKAIIQSSVAKRFVDLCGGDIRKTIMLIQFWCQGHKEEKRPEKEELEICSPQLFDLDAAHQILPKMIPWGFPSQLSEFVDKEITSSLMIDDLMDIHSLEMVIEEDLHRKTTNGYSAMHHIETNSIEAKKEAILSRHCLVDSENIFMTQYNTACELPQSSGSPIAFTRRNVGRRLDTILFSSSEDEDEKLNDGFLEDDHKISGSANDNTLLEVDSTIFSHCLLSNRQISYPQEQLGSIGHVLEETWFEDKTVDSSRTNMACNIVDMSYVSESSFVAETEINVDMTEIFSTPNYANQNELPTVLNDPHVDSLIPLLTINSQMMEITEDVHTEVAYVETDPRRYQVMDECSRIYKPKLPSSSVQETWRKLRESSSDLKERASLELNGVSHVLKLACGVSNIVSELDLLLGDCQQLNCDNVEPQMIHDDKLHSLCWYDEQLKMASVTAHQGISFYAKEITSVGAHMGSLSLKDLAADMLAFSNKSMVLGKLVCQDTSNDGAIRSSVDEILECAVNLDSGLESRLCSVVQSIVPPRSYLSIRGNALHEYLGSLGQILRSENSRLAENFVQQTTRRRYRNPPHYLTNAMNLSSDYISLIGRHSCFQHQ
ncbi:uncharacterized protein LOC124914297 isoform X2 [Impatiens glandulifera]|uniref:uncharacterized protein LOC124914297 isoform X2 n=1 Tax=Impatiens glandulifera TaxID=253017 RepID=UPI001FB0B8CA|nr:uncharacterized protein LOC124914297 isoform X2 [Impatiens glandulifera]